MYDDSEVIKTGKLGPIDPDFKKHRFQTAGGYEANADVVIVRPDQSVVPQPQSQMVYVMSRHQSLFNHSQAHSSCPSILNPTLFSNIQYHKHPIQRPSNRIPSLFVCLPNKSLRSTRRLTFPTTNKVVTMLLVAPSLFFLTFFSKETNTLVGNRPFPLFFAVSSFFITLSFVPDCRLPSFASHSRTNTPNDLRGQKYLPKIQLAVLILALASGMMYAICMQPREDYPQPIYFAWRRILLSYPMWLPPCILMRSGVPVCPSSPSTSTFEHSWPWDSPLGGSTLWPTDYRPSQRCHRRQCQDVT